MLEQSVLEYDNFAYLREKTGFFKTKSTQFFYHVKMEFDDEKRCLVIEQDKDFPTEKAEEKLVRSKYTIPYLPMPTVTHKVGWAQMGGLCFQIRGTATQLVEYHCETGEELLCRKGYHTIWCIIPLDLIEDFKKFIQQRFPITR